MKGGPGTQTEIIRRNPLSGRPLTGSPHGDHCASGDAGIVAQPGRHNLNSLGGTRKGVGFGDLFNDRQHLMLQLFNDAAAGVRFDNQAAMPNDAFSTMAGSISGRYLAGSAAITRNASCQDSPTPVNP